MNILEVFGAGFYTVAFFLLPVLIILVPFVCLVNMRVYNKSDYYNDTLRRWWSNDGIVIILVMVLVDLFLWIPYGHIYKFYGEQYKEYGLLSYVYEVGTYGWVLWCLLMLLTVLFLLPNLIGDLLIFFIKNMKKSRSK